MEDISDSLSAKMQNTNAMDDIDEVQLREALRKVSTEIKGMTYVLAEYRLSERYDRLIGEERERNAQVELMKVDDDENVFTNLKEGPSADAAMEAVMVGDRANSRARVKLVCNQIGILRSSIIERQISRDEEMQIPLHVRDRIRKQKGKKGKAKEMKAQRFMWTKAENQIVYDILDRMPSGTQVDIIDVMTADLKELRTRPQCRTHFNVLKRKGAVFVNAEGQWEVVENKFFKH